MQRDTEKCQGAVSLDIFTFAVSDKLLTASLVHL